MNSAATRLVSALVLTLWMSPGVGALGVGLHLALEHEHDGDAAGDHHGDHNGDHHGGEHPAADHHDAEHGFEVSDLLRAVGHGHHHEATAPEHEHEARLEASLASLRPAACLAIALPESPSRTLSLVEGSPLDFVPRRRPPDSLFTTHCSLLL